MRFVFAGLLAGSLLFFLSSCREGCKDKTALNYDSRAKIENASCLYCTHSYVQDTSTYFFNVDSAPVQPAIEFILLTTDSANRGNGCATVGKYVGDSCNSYLWVVNLTNKHANGLFEVSYDQNGTSVWNVGSSLQLGPHDTMPVIINSQQGCVDLVAGTLDPFFEEILFN